ncbi:hypothetical protein CHS0354_034393 [Potamilus streckersoni]|uniref:Uncharacterized protein n=1 Tax=Potamilus streckersoni TaxID=2493646 RepID=A0AAE0VQV3_9BIVA|nr:hypothetical protein CHS0354_034393 [Potamilus streckersoni]
MKFSFLTVVFLLVLAEHNVLSDCGQNGCECGKHCVNSNDKWCKSNSDSTCSCRPGCLLFGILVPEGSAKDVYCTNSYCSSAAHNQAMTSGSTLCLPEDLSEGVDYPYSPYNNPNCGEEEEDLYIY